MPTLIDLKHRPADAVPAATISLWAKECGLSLTATQIQMLAYQWLANIHLAVASARADQREKACKAICNHCYKGLPIEMRENQPHHFVDDGLQRRGDRGRWVRCHAAAIRDLGAMEEKGE